MYEMAKIYNTYRISSFVLSQMLNCASLCGSNCQRYLVKVIFEQTQTYLQHIFAF